MTTIVIIVLACVALNITRYVYADIETYQTLRGNVTMTELELKIADMQSHTLAISALCVALATIIISMLSILRERRLEISLQELEQSNIRAQQLEESIRTLMNITAVYYLSSDEKDYYYDVVQNYLAQDNTIETNRPFRLSLLNMSAQIAESHGDTETPLLFYNQTIDEAKEIIGGGSTLTNDIQFAYMELLFAYYQRAKHKIKTNPSKSKEDLVEALKYLERFSLANSADTFGDINHMYGLLKLWSILSDAPQEIKGNKKSLAILEESIQHFSNAINKSDLKSSFYNDRSVAYQKMYDVTDELHYCSLAEEDLKRIINAKDAKHVRLNLGSLYVKQIQHRLNLVEFPFSLVNVLIDRPDTLDFEELNGLAKQAETQLKIAIDENPAFPNNHYKLAELYTYWVLIHLLDVHNNTNKDALLSQIDTLRPRIEKSLKDAENLNASLLGRLFVERNYYELVDLDVSVEINDRIHLHHPDNADKWAELIKPII